MADQNAVVRTAGAAERPPAPSATTPPATPPRVTPPTATPPTPTPPTVMAAPAPTAVRPNLTGDLETVLANGPVFRSHLRGYDRLQVDNYVRWAEAEMASARREIEDLASRYGSALAELKISGELLALSPEGRQLQRSSQRMGEILRLAADEAAELRATAAQRAEAVLDAARDQADQLLQRARETEASATADADRLRLETAAAHQEAEASVREARAEASRLLAESAAERDRLDRQSAAERAAAETATARRIAAEEERARRERDAMLTAAALQVTAMHEELDDLTRQRDQARQSLQRLSAQVGEALDGLVRALPPGVQVLAGPSGQPPRQPAVRGNGGPRP